MLSPLKGMNCDACRAALESRRLAPLPAPRQAEVEGHVAGCEGCQRYVKLLETTEATLHTLTDAAAAKVDWARLERVVQAWPRLVRARLALLIGVCVGHAPLIALLFPVRMFLFTVPSVVVTVVCAWLLRARLDARWSRQAAHVTTKQELLAFWRELTSVQLRSFKRLVWLLPASAVFASLVGAGLEAADDSSWPGSWLCRALVVIEACVISYSFRTSTLVELERTRVSLG